MFCSKCGKEINDGAKFCKYCGTNCTKVSEKQATYCPKCGGQGFSRNTPKMVIAIIISLMMLSSLFGFGTMFLVFGGDMVGFILFTIIIGLVLYFGFKKGECPVCQGSGRLYR